MKPDLLPFAAVIASITSLAFVLLCLGSADTQKWHWLPYLVALGGLVIACAIAFGRKT